MHSVCSVYMVYCLYITIIVHVRVYYGMVWISYFQHNVWNHFQKSTRSSQYSFHLFAIPPWLTELFHPQVNAPSDSPSQFFPVQISVQAQKYPPWELVQVPPCSHGGFRHSLVSINRETTKWLHTSPVLWRNLLTAF